MAKIRAVLSRKIFEQKKEDAMRDRPGIVSAVRGLPSRLAVEIAFPCGAVPRDQASPGSLGVSDVRSNFFNPRR